MSAGLGLLLLALLIASNAALNTIEIAVVAANRVRVHHLAEGGSRRAMALQRIQENQERFFATLVLLVNLTVIVSGFLGPQVTEHLLGHSSVLQVVLAFLVVTYMTAAVGDLTPKIIGAGASTSIALAVAPFVELLVRALAPFAAVLNLFPRLLAPLFGIQVHRALTVTEAELRMLIDISAETGSVAEEEAELLERVFHFGDRRVHEVMIPRTETVWLSRDTTVADFYKVYAEHPHSRFPVYDKDTDHVIGIAGIKDILLAISTGQMTPSSPIAAAVRPAYFVPETKLVRELFREMQANRSQMAVAVDEFGGTAGIVTLEQLLEEMVGGVSDELRPPEPEIKPIDASTVEVDGALSIEEAREELGIDIPEGDYDTIAGWVLSILGRIPREGEVIPVDGRQITVTRMKGPKIEVMRVTTP